MNFSSVLDEDAMVFFRVLRREDDDRGEDAEDDDDDQELDEGEVLLFRGLEALIMASSKFCVGGAILK